MLLSRILFIQIRLANHSSILVGSWVRLILAQLLTFFHIVVDQVYGELFSIFKYSIYLLLREYWRNPKWIFPTC